PARARSVALTRLTVAARLKGAPFASLRESPSSMQRYTVFDSALGPIGLVWTERGVVSLLLPERSRRATEAELRARHPSAELAEPSVPIRRAIDKIQKLLRGEKVSLASVPVDLSGVSEFYCSVYELARQIPPIGRAQSE